MHTLTFAPSAPSLVYRVVTPDECIALAHQTGRIILHPLMGGMPPELGWEGLRLFGKKVLPQIR